MKDLLYWLVILLVLWLLWPLIKGLIFIVLLAAVVIFVLAYLNRHKKEDHDVIDASFKVKDKK